MSKRMIRVEKLVGMKNAHKQIKTSVYHRGSFVKGDPRLRGDDILQAYACL